MRWNNTDNEHWENKMQLDMRNITSKPIFIINKALSRVKAKFQLNSCKTPVWSAFARRIVVLAIFPWNVYSNHKRKQCQL